MNAQNLLFLASQHSILTSLAQHLSTRDLLHLARANKALHSCIRASDGVFDKLKAQALCDGRGLQARMEFRAFNVVWWTHWRWGQKGRMANYDEELEVRVWNLKCDAENALPCVKCGINVCEECRYVPRVRDTPDQSSYPQPHLDPGYQLRNIVCYCKPCDEKVEQSLPLFLSEYCACNQYTRWICLPCRTKEATSDKEYFIFSTKGQWKVHVEQEVEGVMMLPDHQGGTYFWCPCGDKAPTGGNIRCSWCLRRHNRDTWMSERSSRIPFFDDDPCYPKIVLGYDVADPVMYPDLGYRGPIAP